jgi:NAD(P)-dependent dehydrogenase (short-subunit alcohol dehydrogenase family)
MSEEVALTARAVPKRRVIVTGVDSGIGRATALVLAERGYDIGMTYGTNAVAHLIDPEAAYTTETTIFVDVEGADYIKNLVARHPIQRQAEPMEIAYGVLFLASDEASYITGAQLPIDGGYTAQ